MKTLEFYLWLKGYLDGLGVVKLNEAQLAVIVAKMNTVSTI